MKRRITKIISSKKWEEETKGLLKAELARNCISHQELADRLSRIGVKATKASVDNKLSRGTFSAIFLLQCLRAIGCNSLSVR